MKIIEINIIQFGKFKDRTFTLEHGFNIVRGDNESGKSTLLGFIKFALYGVGRKNPNVTVGDRERALSWNVGIAAGSLTVEDVDGKRYRIERNGREGARGAFSDKVKIIDLENGTDIYSGEAPGELFLGINAQAYDSMCNIKQLEAVAVGGDAVKGVIDDLLSSGDESASVQGAIKMLDTERRRLLHTNGKGGAVYESEAILERLKNEHRNAIVFENECIKNLDELDNVELSLKKARAEFDVAQNMCDVHDDVLRLERFEELARLKQTQIELERESLTLDSGADFDVKIADYETAARLEARAEALKKSQDALEVARTDMSALQDKLDGIKIENKEGFSRVIEEHSTPDRAISYLQTKKKKRNDASLWLMICGIACAALLAFAVALVAAMNNVSGAATVGFGAIVFGAFALSSYKKYGKAKAEIEGFIALLGEGFCPKNENKIREALESFCKNVDKKRAIESEMNSTRVRLEMSNESHRGELELSRALAKEVNINCDDMALCEEFTRLSQKMRTYLPERAKLDGRINETRSVINALSTELARFNEKDIRARITPEIIEKISKVSFEKLKNERDAALYKSNQIQQYKAGIERNLAASEKRRSSADIFPEIEEQERKVDELKLRFDAVKLAMETIDESSRTLKRDFTPRIRENAQKNLATVTAGKYKELFVDEDMGLSVFAEGATRPIDSLSKGSLDAAYFSVRLALLQTLLADKNPPLYMDEMLSQLDDGRAENVLRTIAQYSETSQCVLFTCQKRDVELAKGVSEVNVIEI